jgi:ABC-type Fe3+-siderophore transport system permease subunit
LRLLARIVKLFPMTCYSTIGLISALSAWALDAQYDGGAWQWLFWMAFLFNLHLWFINEIAFQYFQDWHVAKLVLLGLTISLVFDVVWQILMRFLGFTSFRVKYLYGSYEQD